MEKETNILQKHLDKNLSEKNLLNLYTSEKHKIIFPSFLFSKRVSIILTFIGGLSLIIGFYNQGYINYWIIFGIILITLLFPLGKHIGYTLGTREGIGDGFDTGRKYTQIELIKFLIEKLEKDNTNAENEIISTILMELSNEYSCWESNKNTLEYKVKVIIDKYNDKYWK